MGLMARGYKWDSQLEESNQQRVNRLVERVCLKRRWLGVGRVVYVLRETYDMYCSGGIRE